MKKNSGKSNSNPEYTTLKVSKEFHNSLSNKKRKGESFECYIRRSLK